MHPPMPEYDLVVIGSGSGGQKAAIAAAKLGKSVAVIEHDRMLGNWRPGGRMGHWMLNKAAFSLAPGSLPGALRDRQILGQALRWSNQDHHRRALTPLSRFITRPK